MTKNKKRKIVYIGMVGDIIHPGHLNIIKQGAKLGEVTVGILTDKVVASYKRIPFLTYKQREEVIKNFKGVVRVIPQPTHDYVPNLRKLQADYLVHGDDWRSGPQQWVREKAIAAMKEWGGKLIEPA